jgi:hypothetical protein
MTITQPDAKTNEALRARIRALLNKTTMNNCTEHEAMAAAAKARELMDKYQLDLADLHEVESFVTETVDWPKKRKFDFKSAIAVRVASYCDCRGWMSSAERTLKFFGRESDAMFATWLIDALCDFVAQGWTSYTLDFLFAEKEDYRCSEEDFYYGAATRINERLRLLANERRAATGPGLVVSKSGQLDAAFKNLGLTLHSSKRTAFRSRDGASLAAGQSRADNAAFNRPINNGRKTLLLK